MSGSVRVLLVEDDAALARVLVHNLTHDGFTVQWVADGELAAQAARDMAPDIALLDITLPGRNGFDLCAMWRAEGRFPIIVVTSRDRVEDKLRGLKLGADDYVTKPFVIEELVARIRAVLRRARPQVNSVRLGMIVVDFVNFTARRGAEHVDLSHREFAILQYLAERPNMVVSRGELLRHVWGYAEEPFTRSVDKAILRLRKKVEADPQVPAFIHTAHGGGYRLSSSPEDPPSA